MEYPRASAAASIRLGPRELNHLGPLLSFVGDKPSKLPRRYSHRQAAEIGESRPHLGIGQSCVDLCVEPIHNLSGRIPRRDNAIPLKRLVARHCFVECRNIGELCERRCRFRPQRRSPPRFVPAATDTLAPLQSARRPAARQRPQPDAEIAYVRISWSAPLRHRKAPYNRPRAPTKCQINFSECSPAAGTNAAVNWRDYGRSRWQLSDKITTIAGIHVRGRSTYFAEREAGCGPSRRFLHLAHVGSRPKPKSANFRPPDIADFED
jgi:hypothetical protein